MAPERPADARDPADPAYRWERYDRIVLEGSVSLLVAFTAEWTADLPRSLVTVGYRRENAAGGRFLPSEVLERQIGPDGWGLDLGTALRAMSCGVVFFSASPGTKSMPAAA